MSRPAVLIPVHDGGERLKEVVAAVLVQPVDVLVVDDGSTDGTAALLAARQGIHVVTHPKNRGYGAALVSAFEFALRGCYDVLVTIDCDGQHEPAHIPQFFEALENGSDIISGSRYLPGSSSVGAVPPERREINAIVTARINELTGWNLTDAFCGFKAYKMSALDCLKLEEPGYAMPLELWAKAWKCGMTVSEIPVERIYCDHDRSFGAALDDPEARLRYYREVWKRALEE